MTAPVPRVALVTGGGRRIGAAISRELASEGFAVIVAYRSSRREARRLASEIGGEARRLDLSRPSTFPAFARRMASAHGRLDLLVHNAAIFPRTPLATVTPAEWDAVFAVNLRGPALLTRALTPLLRRGAGGVCFVGDAGAAMLWPAYLPYCVSKLALEAFAGGLARSAPPGIRVGMVRPGLVLPPPGFPEDRWERLRAKAPRRGIRTPRGVARSVLSFACGDGKMSGPIPHRRNVAMKQWRCNVCGYVYDPAKGDPGNGVPPGTPFENIPADWVCPLCGVGKEEFEAVS